MPFTGGGVGFDDSEVAIPHVPREMVKKKNNTRG